MNDEKTAALIERLIDSQILTNTSINETNTTVKHLAKSVEKLIVDNAVREKNDEYQKDKNKAHDKFKEWATPILAKAKEYQADRKKIIMAVVAVVVIGVLRMFDVNFAG